MPDGPLRAPAPADPAVEPEDLKRLAFAFAGWMILAQAGLPTPADDEDVEGAAPAAPPPNGPLVALSGDCRAPRDHCPAATHFRCPPRT
eukprot:5532219-Alexandrium_andersonii.AAC.1